MIEAAAIPLAAALLDRCRRARLTLATAESCTGGLIGAVLTAVPGSSRVYDRGFVTYSNAAKSAHLGVPADLLDAQGAVSEAVARAMADGALAATPVDAVVAVTGIAGPGGGSADRPVGLVHMAAAVRHGPLRHERHLFAGDRDAVRAATVTAALTLLDGLIAEHLRTR